MNILSQINKLSKSLRDARKLAFQSQEDLANSIGVSRDLVVRMEKGENVGIHHFLAAASVLGKELHLDLEIPNSAHVVEGSFDEFYQNHIRPGLEEDLALNPEKHIGLFKSLPPGKIRVVSWKKAANI